MNLTRRDFLKLCGSSSIAALLAACGSAPTPTATPALMNTPLPTSTPLLTATPALTSTPAPTSTATVTATATATATLRPLTLRDLADKIGFRIGAFFGSNTTPEEWERITAVQIREFNLRGIFVGMSLTQPKQGSFDVDVRRRLAERAIREKMDILVHPLVWGDDLPSWLRNRGVTRNELVEIMKNHITTLMKQFVEMKATYVVANEAYYTDRDFFNRVIGKDYVDIAFETARSANPSAALIYNDNNNHTPFGERTSPTQEIVQRLKSKGLLDGVGLQMHLRAETAPAKKDVIETMRNYGLPIHVTEFDVNIRNIHGSQEERYAKQAQIYKEMLEAAIESGVCKEFITFHIGDKFSFWENTPSSPYYSREADPTPFDDNLKPKPAYFAMLEVLQRFAK
ncbi:MAG: endo-1,4-beta-xylanase [Chloroflexi bacterium]|nr:endo-1,4-beta-xylanase [Chloroflexota bacterium]